MGRPNDFRPLDIRGLTITKMIFNVIMSFSCLKLQVMTKRDIKLILMRLTCEKRNIQLA